MIRPDSNRLPDRHFKIAERHLSIGSRHRKSIYGKMFRLEGNRIHRLVCRNLDNLADCLDSQHVLGLDLFLLGGGLLLGCLVAVLDSFHVEHLHCGGFLGGFLHRSA